FARRQVPRPAVAGRGVCHPTVLRLAHRLPERRKIEAVIRLRSPDVADARRATETTGRTTRTPGRSTESPGATKSQAARGGGEDRRAEATSGEPAQVRGGRPGLQGRHRSA